MVGEAIGVLKNATSDHETVDFGIFFVEFERMGAVHDIAVDDEFGLRGDFIAELN